MSNSHHKGTTLPAKEQAHHTAAQFENSPSTAQSAKKSTHLFSSTAKGIIIGAVAGRFLPVLNTFTGALVGGITAKVLEYRQKPKHAHS